LTGLKTGVGSLLTPKFQKLLSGGDSPVRFPVVAVRLPCGTSDEE
jgi:hypothetical protein